MLLLVGLGALGIAVFFVWSSLGVERTHEGTRYLRILFDSSGAYWGAEHRAVDGSILTPRFPRSAPLTPATTACRDGKFHKHQPTPDMWSHPTWRALGFTIEDPFLYQYQYVSDGQRFTARAIGDRDCDGVLSTFERVGRIVDGRLDEGPGVLRKNELE
jgi:hypothetical protein